MLLLFAYQYQFMLRR